MQDILRRFPVPAEIGAIYTCKSNVFESFARENRLLFSYARKQRVAESLRLGSPVKNVHP